MCVHLHGEEEKPAEGRVSVQVIEHSAVIPQLHVHLVASRQSQNNRVTAAVRAVGCRAFIGGDLKEAVLH